MRILKILLQLGLTLLTTNGMEASVIERVDTASSWLQSRLSISTYTHLEHSEKWQIIPTRRVLKALKVIPQPDSSEASYSCGPNSVMRALVIPGTKDPADSLNFIKYNLISY